jgi:hypothetical protein
MRRTLLFALPLFVAFATGELAGQEKDKGKKFKITWKKIILDKKFRSEGVAVADVDKDGKKDILVGDLWYQAPDWKPHVIRADKDYRDGQKNVYSKTFAVFADDLDGDGYPDMIVIGFPGAPCHWYKNPGKSGGKWAEHMIQDDACNETPQYVDLLGTGKRGLILGHKGEMCFFIPGPDPTKPWTRISISGPPAKGQTIPGTFKFAHGLGAGDVNGDGKLDVMCNAGWWEQPSSDATKGSWKFHPYKIEDCADIYAFDIDGDGKNDLVSSAAHRTGFWWHQQKAGKDHPAFVSQLLFPIPNEVAKKTPEGVKFTKEEQAIYDAIRKVRTDQKHVPWRAEPKLVGDARGFALYAATSEDGKVDLDKARYPGEIVAQLHGDLAVTGPADIVRNLLDKFPKAKDPGLELGVGVFQTASGNKRFCVVLGDRGVFALPGQTHALNFVDVDGDGLKDFVTGRRYWAHGPTGDDQPADPAYLYWFKAKKDKTGLTTFAPMKIDDESGVGTQFAVEDVDGDGLLDIVISNKYGVFLFLQVREAIIDPVPPPVNDDN